MFEPDVLRLEQIRDSAEMLNDLLKRLHPEPFTPDIISLDDIRRRYPLTGLGAPAMAAIGQARRIIRALGDHNKVGLCEFHIGLIYLYWGDCRGAMQQFREAQMQWSFIHQTPSVCLAHFAAGIAQHHSFDRETAMHSYGKVEQLLPRIHFFTPSKELDVFVEAITPALHAAQETLRQEMWGIPERPGRGEPDQAEFKEHCRWYKVNQKKDASFLPQVDEDVWLLVDEQIAGHEYKQDELLVIRKNNIANGSVVLRPHAINQIFRRIYLASSQFEGTFTRNRNTGKVALSSNLTQIPVLRTEMLGVVVGFWLNVEST